MFANVGAFATAEGARAMGRAAEGAGFESVWPVEHVLVPQGYESEYPYDPSGRMPLAEVIAALRLIHDGGTVSPDPG